MIRRLAGLILFLSLFGASQALGQQDALREFHPYSGARWIGNAVCYGPHRDGQRPGGPSPSREELRQDLDLMLAHWNLMRIYGADPLAEDILHVIRDGELDMKVMLGVWIAPDADQANSQQVARAIRLALRYPDIILAVCVGNETQVSWSAHRSSLDALIGHVRQVRAQVKVPVTVADDYNFWNKPESKRLALELDFLTVHAHPMWNGQQLEEALPWVQTQLAEVQALHPDRPLVLGETGWATQVHDQGEQARLIKGKPGVNELETYLTQVQAWADSTRQTVFFFEAFDENWKGGEHPAEVEKHWGVFRADRSAKGNFPEEKK
jgi:exo-beta-1,3-glucanase (GH17 family)